ncbi:hypothetical protein GUITHDRAFT_151185 [Guillardia theta CCMP2712]|uniref:Protein kinase domain-containing protein n=1 Tax=Guillardia theta (strain CCMP2712) TaxID=905079 RepID=L1JQT5_GUITC|nr:hypothetical protein GUITHDRAFT_151185 [Guillardia theta CCMP2712]EKX50560.1 hypothetical protein GUITHDRAFT_151185 [Guillardia theta CCMP2712]|eukprot:XP_005837540.1 hypothetical protein GUITHDRAFT_151185 [Guillardia theta CCMP2712]
MNSPPWLSAKHKRVARDSFLRLKSLPRASSSCSLDGMDIEQWDVTDSDILGEGSHSVVFKYQTPSGSIYAVKEPRSPVGLDSPKSSDCSQHLRHANIVSHKVFGSKGRTVMEYIDGGSVHEVMESEGAFDEERTKEALYDVLLGLSYLHRHGIVHKDIKPANILYDTTTDSYKLCDWVGDCDQVSSANRGVSCPVGSPSFLAPEVIRTQHHSEASDIWGVGCTALNMLTGKVPWEKEDNVFAIMFKVSQGHHPEFPSDKISDNMRDFLELCFKADAEERPSAVELLNHPLFIVDESFSSLFRLNEDNESGTEFVDVIESKFEDSLKFSAPASKSRGRVDGILERLQAQIIGDKASKCSAKIDSKLAMFSSILRILLF